jgi:hypothetical protein
MNITITKNENGLYLTTEFRGCKYGQFYKDINETEATNRFRDYVRLLDCGRYLEVMRGN